MLRLAVFVCLLLTLQAIRADQICQPPKSESTFFLTDIMEDFYKASDFELNKIIGVFGSNQGDTWFLGDMNTGILYLNTSAGCKYTRYSDEQNELFAQCLPASAKLERSGLVDFYSVKAPTLTWLVGMQPVPDTEFYFKHFSRFSIDNVISAQSSYGIVYKYSLDISDPAVFDKDLSSCVEAQLDQIS